MGGLYWEVILQLSLAWGLWVGFDQPGHSKGVSGFAFPTTALGLYSWDLQTPREDCLRSRRHHTLCSADCLVLWVLLIGRKVWRFVHGAGSGSSPCASGSAKGDLWSPFLLITTLAFFIAIGRRHRVVGKPQQSSLRMMQGQALSNLLSV